MLLICTVGCVYRKYQHASAESKYLKGMMREKNTSAGKETLFEFQDQNNAHHESDDDKEDIDIEIAHSSL